MAVAQEPVTVYGGDFASQPLVFAHLLDAMPGLDLDHVEVICGGDPGPRLAHGLVPEDARRVEDALGMMTTVVLIFDAAVAGRALPHTTGRLTRLALCTGLRHRP